MMEFTLIIMSVCSLICFLIAWGISSGLTVVGWFVYTGLILACPAVIYFTIDILIVILPILWGTLKNIVKKGMEKVSCLRG